MIPPGVQAGGAGGGFVDKFKALLEKELREKRITAFEEASDSLKPWG
jgi:hypothetical protein